MKLYNDIEQQTPAWFFLRKGKVSGTDLKAIMGTPSAKKKLYYKKIAEMLSTGTNEREEDPRDRGNRLEDEARAMFEFKTGKTVLTTGFAESLENERMGYSPDGLIKPKDGELITEDIEVKSFEGAMFVETWLENKVPSDYYAQLIQGFIVNPHMEKRYFIAYCPEIEIYPLHIIEVKRSDVQGDIATYKVQELMFIKEVEDRVASLLSEHTNIKL